ncbi:carboxypeptidase-like regulatory domain-containing protein, partial [Escherichia coli]|nr:carboxypeptidase-like regulatory domain-containing protein [Escherichia coli]
ALFGGTFLFAQTKVTGMVEDVNGPIDQATVNVKGTNITTTTDVDGLYQLTLEPGKYEIIVSKIGETTTTQTINVLDENEVSLDFFLQSINSETDLSEVVLIGSRAVGRTQLDSSTPVDVIDIKEVTKDVGQVSLNQILNYVAPSFSSN